MRTRNALALLLALFAVAAVLPSCDEETIPALPCWQDVQVTSVNAETRRTEVVFYPSAEDALRKGFRQSPNYLDLNGVWDFHYFDDHREMEAFVETLVAPGEKAPEQAAEWSPIRVPGNWERQGYGIAIYTNQPYDFCPKNPVAGVLPEVVPGGVYHRSFTVPAGWEGRRVYLNLAGAKSGVYVYVNGKEIGYGEDSKSLARYEVSDVLREGDNELVLKIYRYSTGSFLECQDFWRISGIERDVYLSSEAPETVLKDFRVVSTLDETLTEGLFRLSVEGESPDFGYELLDQKDSVILSGGGPVHEKAAFEGTVPDVRKWSAETPELYNLILRAGDEYTRFHVGFRRLEIKEYPIDEQRTVHVFLVNGQPVKFKGVNLHEHNEYTGHYTDRALILKDLALMRAANINAIRTCHYPQPREFYELCDSLGFYVYNETNIESHGMGYKLDRTLGNNPDWLAKHMDRVLNLYARTGNYPCVTVISLGNEAGNGENFYRCYEAVKELEKDGQNRPVCYERAEYEWNTDMIVPQYPGADWFRAMGEGYDERPVCPSEYAHAMGNSTGSLDLQWEAIYAWPHLQGAYIWDWVDQGFAEVDSLGRKYWTYGGDYGVDTPSDANFLCNGIVNPDRNPHPGYYEVRHVYQDAVVEARIPEKGAFRLVNRFYFKDLNGYKLSYRILADGVSVKEGVVAFNDIVTVGPQSYFDFTIPLPTFLENKEYYIVFSLTAQKDELLVKKGNEIASDQILLQKRHSGPKRLAAAKAVVYENEERVVLSSGKAELEFDKSLGRITYWRVAGVDLIDPAFGLRPNFWRGPTDNDYGNGLPSRLQVWKQSSLLPKVESVTVEDGGCITAVYALPDETTLTMALRMLEGGAVRIASAFKGNDRPDRPSSWSEQTAEQAYDVPRLGYRTRVVKEDWPRFSYYGRGPVENYWDRCSGAFLGEYESTPAAEFYPYVRPQETGHHTDVRYLKGGTFTVVAEDEPFEFNVLQQYVEDLDSEEATGCDYQWLNFDPAAEKDPAAARNRLRRQTHLTDVPEREDVEICLDYRMSGVGGYDSWGSWPEHDRSLWDNRDYTWSFVLVPNK